MNNCEIVNHADYHNNDRILWFKITYNECDDKYNRQLILNNNIQISTNKDINTHILKIILISDKEYNNYVKCQYKILNALQLMAATLNVNINININAASNIKEI